jgi:phospholipid/cholesterol/gamma-HCH transport system permease protein
VDSPGINMWLRTRERLQGPDAESWSGRRGRDLIQLAMTVRGLGSFALITLGVLLRKPGHARLVMRPLIRREIDRAGIRLLPLFLFLAGALGLVVVGQAVSWLSRFAAIDYLGSIMVVTVVREIGPVLTTVVVLARVGTANVVELGTARALGELEALESMGVDPVHYLVVPRVMGMAMGVFALTIYLILGSLASGYLWAFIQDVPLQPGEYARQLAAALGWMDFALLGLKTAGFGFIIAIVTCYHGLARPLRLEDVPEATVRAVAQGLVCCVLLDALFILAYLLV